MSTRFVSKRAAEPGYPPSSGQFNAGRRRMSGAVWAAMRGTGLLLSILVLGHLLFVHLLTDVARTSASFVDRRWSSGLWVTWDGTMLTAAFLHGAIGMTTVVRDYTGPGLARRTWLATIYTVSAALCGLGWYAIAATVMATK